MYTIEKLKGLFASGKIGRRDFIQGAVALGATISAATSMSTSVMASPKKGGTLRLAMSSGTTTDILDMENKCCFHIWNKFCFPYLGKQKQKQKQEKATGR